MPDIRYVCLSDLHFGAENSVLTCLSPGTVVPDPHHPSRLLTAFAEGLAELVSRNEDGHRPTLVLCGDILDLALSADNVAAMVFERFIEVAFPAHGRLFDDTIYYVPGNHDHHVWETARELQYSHYLRTAPPDTDLALPRHTTGMLPERDPHPVNADMLTTLVRRFPHLHDVSVRTVYPNLALASPDGSRVVILHHGHFVEALYRLMSTLKTMAFPERRQPNEVDDWEAENFAWIDFFWSTLGRSGRVGTDVGLLYASLQSEEAMRRVARNLAHGIAARLRGPQSWRWLEERAIRLALGLVARRAGRLERSEPGAALTPRARRGLEVYLEGPVRNQLVAELGGTAPEHVTFVFGHTHKPFETRLSVTGYPAAVDVFNTGGWVVDTIHPAPRQGAAAILIDEDLETVSLRVYNQSPDGSPLPVVVARADGQSPGGPFFRRISEMVDSRAPLWSQLSASAAALVDERHRDLATILAPTSPATPPSRPVRQSHAELGPSRVVSDSPSDPA